MRALAGTDLGVALPGAGVQSSVTASVTSRAALAGEYGDEVVVGPRRTRTVPVASCTWTIWLPSPSAHPRSSGASGTIRPSVAPPSSPRPVGLAVPELRGVGF